MSADWHDFQGVNAAYVLDLYERFQRDPKSVDPATRKFFEEFGASGFWDSGNQRSDESPNPQVRESSNSLVVVGAVNLAQSIRRYGHLAAQIDPLGSRPMGDPALEPETHGVREADLRALPAKLIFGPVADGAASMW